MCAPIVGSYASIDQGLCGTEIIAQPQVFHAHEPLSSRAPTTHHTDTFQARHIAMSQSKGKQRHVDEEQAERVPLIDHKIAAAPTSASRRRAAFRALALAAVLLAGFYVINAWRQALQARHPGRVPPPLPDPVVRPGHNPSQRNPAYLSASLLRL